MTVISNTEERDIGENRTVGIQNGCSPRAPRETGWGAVEMELIQKKVDWLNNVLNEFQVSVANSVMHGIKLGIITFPFNFGSDVVKYGLSTMLGFIIGQLLYLKKCLQETPELPPWEWSIYSYGGAILGLIEAHGWGTIYNISGFAVAIVLGFTIKKEWSWRIPAMVLGAALSLSGSIGGLGTPVLWICAWIAFCACLSFLVTTFNLQRGPKTTEMKPQSKEFQDEDSDDSDDDELDQYLTAVLSGMRQGEALQTAHQTADEFAGVMAQICNGNANVQLIVTPAENGSRSGSPTPAAPRRRPRSRSHSPFKVGSRANRRRIQ